LVEGEKSHDTCGVRYVEMAEKRPDTTMAGAFKVTGSGPNCLHIHSDESPVSVQTVVGWVRGNGVRVDIVENLFHCDITGERIESIGRRHISLDGVSTGQPGDFTKVKEGCI
jgi:hypothetical protein